MASPSLSRFFMERARGQWRSVELQIRMSTAKGMRVVGYYDCPGGGQVVGRKNAAYVGHVKPPTTDPVKRT
jgi:hypothetical protein